MKNIWLHLWDPTFLKKKSKIWILWWFGHFLTIWKKKMSRNEQNCQNFCKKMKFKTRLVVGNGIWWVKIWLERLLSPLKLLCKIFWPHLKNSLKKYKKTSPPPKKKGLFFWGGGSGTCAQCVLGWLKLRYFKLYLANLK